MRALAVVIFALLTPLLTAAAPGPWAFERDGSRIEMSVRAFGGTHSGVFEDWRGSAEIDPAHTEASRASVTVRAASLKMSPSIASSRAVGPAFLDAARYPVIRFDLQSLETLNGDRYTAQALVTMKGVTRPVAFPVDLRLTGDRAHLTGGFVLNRADFGIGTSGPWNRLVGRQVTVRVALQARRV